jgi:hypothetical protein
MDIIWDIREETVKHARNQIRSPTWANTNIRAVDGEKKFRRSHGKRVDIGYQVSDMD